MDQNTTCLYKLPMVLSVHDVTLCTRCFIFHRVPFITEDFYENNSFLRNFYSTNNQCFSSTISNFCYIYLIKFSISHLYVLFGCKHFPSLVYFFPLYFGVSRSFTSTYLSVRGKNITHHVLVHVYVLCVTG